MMAQILFYYGDDEYQLSQACETVISTMCAGDWGQLNLSRLAGDTDFDTLRLHLTTPPFGNGRRLVVADNSDWLKTAGDADDLAATLDAALTTTVLLVRFDGKPDGRLKLVKVLKSKASVSEFMRLAPWQTTELTQRVRTAANAHGLRLDSTLCQTLAETVGTDTRLLHNELAKLAVLGDRQLTAALVREAVDCSTYSALKLADALRVADTHEALNLLAGLFATNEHPLRVLATLLTQFRTWHDVKLYGDRSQVVGNPKRLYYLKSEVAKVPAHRLRYGLTRLFELEVAIKTGNDAAIACELAVIDICTR